MGQGHKGLYVILTTSWHAQLSLNLAMLGSLTIVVARHITGLTWGGDLVAVGGKVALVPIPLGTMDFLVHHIHAFMIHVTVLILLKGVLFARSSCLIQDKENLGFRFPCDGLGGGHVKYQLGTMSS
ncbi:Photosystem I P700 chlorophyll a apoprotein A1 [Helianthus debilis subsp. tardiflorus]